jgi:hypothetical protein
MNTTCQPFDRHNDFSVAEKTEQDETHTQDYSINETNSTLNIISDENNGEKDEQKAHKEKCGCSLCDKVLRFELEADY